MKPYWTNRIVGHGEEPLESILFNPSNWRIHPQYQQRALESVLDEVGLVQTVIVNKTTGNLVDGHLRCQLAERHGEKTIPVTYVELSEEEEALVLATFDPIGASAATDKEQLKTLLESLNNQSAEINSFLNNLSYEEGLTEYLEKGKSPAKSSRVHPLDYYITISNNHPHILLLKSSGIGSGIQSSESYLKGSKTELLYSPGFIDNDYYKYRHQMHLAVVAKYLPKYATVRDIMDETQCEIAGIEYYPLEQILEWAEEINQYAENVILIPKYDCLDKLPEKFVLGYSIPTSHGATPLPISAFKGRKIHLLGGSWKYQLAHLEEMGDDVVSADNNYEFKIAKYGQYTDPEGNAKQLSETIGFNVTNPMITSLALSIGAIGTKLKEIYTPTNHEPTTLPIEAFSGRRLSIMGGEVIEQMRITEQMGQDVEVILDSSTPRAAMYGQYVNTEGEIVNLEDTFDYELTSPEGIALSLSLGAIGAKLQELKLLQDRK